MYSYYFSASSHMSFQEEPRVLLITRLEMTSMPKELTPTLRLTTSTPHCLHPSAFPFPSPEGLLRVSSNRQVYFVRSVPSAVSRKTPVGKSCFASAGFTRTIAYIAASLTISLGFLAFFRDRV
jgi:hypothetical protein